MCSHFDRPNHILFRISKLPFQHFSVEDSCHFSGNVYLYRLVSPTATFSYDQRFSELSVMCQALLVFVNLFHSIFHIDPATAHLLIAVAS
ncbi:hypothetical protein CEXT_34781 [Caerostris extrusa]|uniref:Uncharacterized protein n=1 Tax=Caerostris extrusa TaxID=172846 RepID=A0AAV4VU91_CAEEX|nr:hypothetical protein CEXT_34781 [Caerostris extrusa]